MSVQVGGVSLSYNYGQFPYNDIPKLVLTPETTVKDGGARIKDFVIFQLGNLCSCIRKQYSV